MVHKIPILTQQGITGGFSVEEAGRIVEAMDEVICPEEVSDRLYDFAAEMAVKAVAEAAKNSELCTLEKVVGGLTLNARISLVRLINKSEFITNGRTYRERNEAKVIREFCQQALE